MSRFSESRLLVELLAGRWTLAVLEQLAGEGISHKVLTETLRRAERDGLIARHLDPGRVETATLYRLTDLARSLGEPLAALERWSETDWPHVEAARRRWNELRRTVG
jgi:DNA-binding HxlR family transcriptional regulator